MPPVQANRKTILSNRLKRYVDLNTDFGQAVEAGYFADPDNSLLPFVSTVYIPCGVHESDPADIRRMILLAKQYNCAIGAHLGLPDPKHLGNQPMPDLSPESLKAWLLVQLGAFRALAESVGAPVEQVRPHGALYSAFFNDPDTARLLAKTVYKFDNWLTLVGPAGAAIEKLEAEIGVRIGPEMHLGKRYNQHGEPVKEEFRVDMPQQAVLNQARQLITDSSMVSVEGVTLKMRFSTLHLSPRLENALFVAERLNLFLGQPVSLSLAAAGASGWL
jgi:5-oxoprolinase (ATP-hydrolysing) subunit A